MEFITNSMSPIQAWIKGLQKENPLNAYNTFDATDKTTTIGCKPTYAREFNNLYKVIKTKKLTLQPGQQHDHTVYHKYNKIVDSVRYQNSSSTSIQGLTRFALVVFHGLLGH